MRECFNLKFRFFSCFVSSCFSVLCNRSARNQRECAKIFGRRTAAWHTRWRSACGGACASTQSSRQPGATATRAAQAAAAAGSGAQLPAAAACTGQQAGSRGRRPTSGCASAQRDPSGCSHQPTKAQCSRQAPAKEGLMQVQQHREVASRPASSQPEQEQADSSS
ncbi:hypothetical protein C2845_PM03G31710 [Panicum miliaceum]|uniref:Uncharacterized protein n=1 Tax=Panicum miliaceum TaxID=4540 RepID=A0A3L6T7W3_PANMI|nr:hypothetical protein C2845_PM03G31710 [Panicum miliaceum]